MWCLFGAIFFSIFVISNVLSAPINGTETEAPVLVHVLFRHGHRTSYRFYPTDPYINHTFYPIGRAGLTNKGKLTAHRLGEILRKEYGTILGEYYTPETLYVRSTDTVRTRFTAQLVVSGLWPPTGQQKWHPLLDWQPIVIDVKPSEDEDLLEFGSCNLRNKLIVDMQNDKLVYDTFLLPHKELITYIEENSGLKIKDLRDLITIYFTLKTESEVDLELPQWTKKVYPDALKAATARTYEYLTFHPKLKQFHSGFLFKKWFDDIEAKINNRLTPPERKMFLYSAHESTLGYILTALNATEAHVPDYASAILVELHKKESKHYLKFRYVRQPLLETITDLVLPDCDVLCPFETVSTRYRHLIPSASFEELCKIESASAPSNNIV